MVSGTHYFRLRVGENNCRRPGHRIHGGLINSKTRSIIPHKQIYILIRVCIKRVYVLRDVRGRWIQHSLHDDALDGSGKHVFVPNRVPAACLGRYVVRQ